MDRNSQLYQTYLAILQRELAPAMGCTEPIAIAFCAAKAREVLGALPEEVTITASGNIIKNVKSVVVPNTDGSRGIEAAAAIGILAGRADRQLEVIADVSPELRRGLPQFLYSTRFVVKPAFSDLLLDISVALRAGEHTALVRIVNEHTNIVRIEKDDVALLDQPVSAAAADGDDPLCISDIVDFADTLCPEDVSAVFDRQIAMNTAISEEGLRSDYGATIGKILLKVGGDDLRTRARAKAAAGSDARMNGCELPVVINSGSGNQGLTVSIPVIEYANERGASRDALYRALAVSNLTSLHVKAGIGRLSAYCGAVSAGAGAGAGVAYLCGGGLDAVNHTIVNALAITSGIVCDGAKASCAAKIASAVDAGLLGYEMYQNGQQFFGGDGLVSKGVENTIRNIAILGREGMKETDHKIIQIMTGC